VKIGMASCTFQAHRNISKQQRYIPLLPTRMVTQG